MIGSLFSGIGGIEMGLELCGLGPISWQCDSDPHARAVLATHWPSVHRYNDVKEIGNEAPPVDIVCGGFPCQDISLAGKGAGIDGARSGLWSEYARIVRALRPSVVFVENVAALVNRGLDRVLGDLAALGFDAEWDVFRASDVGAPHRRERLFLLAYSDGERVRKLAEWGSWRGAGERATEREHAEPLHDRTALADTDSLVRDGREREPWRKQIAGASVDGNGAPDGSPMADTMRSGLGAGERDVRARQPNTDRRGEGVADAYRAGREGLRRGEPSGPRRTDAAELRARDVADATGSRRDVTEDPRADSGHEGARTEAQRRRTPRRQQSERDGGGALANTDSNGREGIGRGGVLDRERPAFRNDIDRRHRAHRFPPGPAAIAEWDGPQPAIHRGDDGVPGRSHRLRLLGNSVVPQQAALAWRTLTARVAQARAA